MISEAFGPEALAERHFEMPHILIIDSSDLCRELLGKVLEAKGISVNCASTCSAADEFLRVADVIVLDPATDHGEAMSWLKRKLCDPTLKKFGTIILTDVSTKDAVLRAAQLGIRDFMLKQRFSLKEILARIEKLCTPSVPNQPRVVELSTPATVTTTAPVAAPVPLSPVHRLTREQTLARVEESKQSKTLPGVITEIIGLVNSPRGAISEVAHTLKRDPVLAARVLQLANSAAFMSQKPRVTNLDEATRNIGTSGVRAMVLSAGIFELFTADGAAAIDLLRFWQHSFAVAAVMERLLPGSDTIAAGTPHLVGLCHDLAELSLTQLFSDECAAAIELSRNSAESIVQSRSRVFGMPYHDLVSVLLKKLGLPATIIAPIAEVVERSGKGGQAELRTSMAKALRMANIYANGLMLPAGSDAPVTPISLTEFKNTFKDGNLLQFDDEALRSEVLMMVNVLSGAPSRVITQLCQAPLEKSEIRVWYTRHAVYGEFDPLAAFLGLVAIVQVHDRLPATATDIESCDLICIADPRQENPLPAQQQIGNLLRALNANPKPILYFSGVEPQLLSAIPHGKCAKLPVQMPALIEMFKEYSAEASMAIAA